MVYLYQAVRLLSKIRVCGAYKCQRVTVLKYRVSLGCDIGLLVDREHVL